MSILGTDGQEIVKQLPKVTGVRPYGSRILVKILTTKEIMATTIDVGDAVSPYAPQAYILAVGPGVPPESGIAAGQRIFWQGRGVPLDAKYFEEPNRDYALLEVHNVAAIIDEEV